MSSAFVFVFLLAIVPMTGIVMAMTPYFMPRRECFAVTVPESAYDDPRLGRLRATYLKQMLVITLVCTAGVGIVLAQAAGRGFAGDAALSVTGAVIIGTLLPLVCGFALMLRNRRKVQALKRAEGWRVATQQAAAVIAEEDVPRAVSLAWNLLYIPIILLVVALGVMWYPQMPDLIPMQMGFDGEINSYAEKSVAVVFGFPVGIVVFLAACMVFGHWSILRSKCPTGIGAPLTSAFAYGSFARAESVLLVGNGLLLAAVLGVAFMTSSAGFMDLGGMAVLVLMACVPLLVGSIVLMVVYGQAGSRLYARMQAAGTADAPLTADMPFDDDEHWKLGVFYFNKDDASLFLPERFGVGWTVNLARPAAWAVLVGIALFTVAFVALCFALVG